MKRIKNFFKKQQGSVSIYFLVVNLGFFIFSSVLIDYMRVMVAERNLEHATKAAAASIMSDYDDKVLDKFNVFVYGGDVSKAESLATEISQDNIVSDENFYNVAELNLKKTSVEFSKDKTLLNDKTLENQLLEAGKYTSLLTLGDDFVKIIGFFKDNKESIENTGDIVSQKDKIEALIKKRDDSIEDFKKQVTNLTFKSLEFEKLSTEKLWKDKVLASHRDNLVGKEGPEQQKLDDLDKQLKEEEAKSEEEKDEKLINNYKIAIKKQKNVIELIDLTGKKADERLTAALSSVTKVKEDAEKKMEKLKLANEALGKANESNEELKELINSYQTGGADTSDGQLKESLNAMIIKQEVFDKMQKPMASAIKEFNTYQGYVSGIELTLKPYVELKVRIGIGTFYLLAINSEDNEETIEKKINDSYQTIEAKALAETILVIGIGTQILKAVEAAVELAKKVDIVKAKKEIDAAKKQSESQSVTHELTDKQKEEKKKLQDDENTGYTDLMTTLSKANSIATSIGSDSKTYSQLSAIMTEMNGATSDSGKTEANNSAFKLVKQAMKMIPTYFNEFSSVEKIRNKILINEYYLNTIGSNQPEDLISGDMYKDFLFDNKKVEYIMYGSHEVGANYTMALMEIICFRIILNIIAAFKSPRIMPFKGTPFFLGAMVAYTIFKTVEDISKLTKKDFSVREDRAVSIINEFPNLQRIQVTYKDHLRLMLLAHPRSESQYKRVIALMEQQTGVEKLYEKSTQVKVTNTAEVELWFLPKAMEVISNGKIRGKKLKLTNTKYSSY
ncbi:hypothetical protein CKN80_05580 [Carnobacterium divergens]|uniref:TadE/TadG family type IV pilus assembly protein n=1 Tax=Carnobacterium divergens TaxID=2748 RepID=UPI0010728DA5|nr:hypothetical protein [Carnobacterium divergens]TFJ46295.1 hypothetical protein CKN79_05575 [Carnobacterium divergens]TFJ52634.1 hypothetical protein CKN80_05580 [Carnobacterium divergens]